jgi:hypothetical protein
LTDYTKATNFTSKDSLSTGNPLKIVKGTEIDTEFNNIQTAIATKTDNANAAITGGSITGITDLAVADGGTGASTASGARTNLSAASSGANSDITSITGLTTPLTVAQGGIGAATLTANNVLLGNGTSALQTVAPGTAGNVLTSNGTTWSSSSPSGVTSAVAGNGIAVSGSTGAVTFSVAAPSAASIGSYIFGYSSGAASGPISYNSTYSDVRVATATNTTMAVSGTYRCLGSGSAVYLGACIGYTNNICLFVRVS